MEHLTVTLRHGDFAFDPLEIKRMVLCFKNPVFVIQAPEKHIRLACHLYICCEELYEAQVKKFEQKSTT